MAKTKSTATVTEQPTTDAPAPQTTPQTPVTDAATQAAQATAPAPPKFQSPIVDGRVRLAERKMAAVGNKVSDLLKAASRVLSLMRGDQSVVEHARTAFELLITDARDFAKSLGLLEMERQTVPAAFARNFLQKIEAEMDAYDLARFRKRVSAAVGRIDKIMPNVFVHQLQAAFREEGIDGLLPGKYTVIISAEGLVSVNAQPFILSTGRSASPAQAAAVAAAPDAPNRGTSITGEARKVWYAEHPEHAPNGVLAGEAVELALKAGHYTAEHQAADDAIRLTPNRRLHRKSVRAKGWRTYYIGDDGQKVYDRE